ncbi:MAG: histidine triad family protein [Methanobacterium sp.]|jgi:diadenosine tetraphosphate (Ap4A) HIT family hydrolase|uniref:HIT family protein n=1 Tax=Methanobacterium sp. TaxID=2164 RepID=UPI0003C93075|nr:HIT family protein [Methanobacterium sp.]MDI3549555.1 histidine triad family protein [Methanobacterium sp.]CDG65150.1 histidine triad (HIT) protein [Methanobacterium sp. MB1]
MSIECSFCEKLDEYDFGDPIFETEHWIVFLAPNQSNLGTCVVALKREQRTLTGLSPEEWNDFIRLLEKMEKAVKSAFDATLFNWGCLMNTFYLDGTPEPQLHWHFIPRYNHEVEFAGHTFDDPHFGHMHPRPLKDISPEVRDKIAKKIREFL